SLSYQMLFEPAALAPSESPWAATSVPSRVFQLAPAKAAEGRTSARPRTAEMSASRRERVANMVPLRCTRDESGQRWSVHDLVASEVPFRKGYFRPIERAGAPDRSAPDPPGPHRTGG